MENPTKKQPFGAPSEPFILAGPGFKVLLFFYYLVILAVLVFIGSGTIWQAEAHCPSPTCDNERRPPDGGAPEAAIARPGGGPGAAGAGGSGGAIAATGGSGGATRPDGARRYTEGQMLLLVIIFGALGGTLHGLSSAAAHAGNARLYANWTLFYYARPWVGAGMALVVYLVVRGGVGGFALDNDRRGEFAAMGWAALAGLFSAPAMQKLRDVFESILRPSNSSPPSSPPSTGKGGPPPEAPAPPVQSPTAPLAKDPPKGS